MDTIIEEALFLPDRWGLSKGHLPLSLFDTILKS
jgi:hypothetical protein